MEIEAQREIVHICCPQCNEQTTADRCKRWSTYTFSNLKCTECDEVSSTKEWRCTCGSLWFKCPLHRMSSGRRMKVSKHKHNIRAYQRKLLAMKFGTDKPKPHHRFPRGTPTREEAPHVYRHGLAVKQLHTPAVGSIKGS